MLMTLVGPWLIPTTPCRDRTLDVESFRSEIINSTNSAFATATDPCFIDLVVAQVPIRLRATDPELLSAFADALAQHEMLKTGPTPNAPSTEIRIWSSKATGIARPQMPRSVTERVIARRADLVPGAAYQLDFDPAGRILTLMDPESASVDVCLSDIALLPQWERAAPLRSALGWILRRSDRHPIHAAAVTNARGAALLLGAGGAGKSTTSLRCRQEGMGFVGDDICVIETNPTPRIFNLYGTAKTVWSDRSRFPELEKYLVTNSAIGNEKAVYAVSKCVDHQIVSSSEVRVLILLDKSLPVGQAQAADPATVVALVASTTASFLPGSGRPLLPALSSLVRQIPVIRLSVGQDPAQVSQLINSAIDTADTLPRSTRAC